MTTSVRAAPSSQTEQERALRAQLRDALTTEADAPLELSWLGSGTVHRVAEGDRPVATYGLDADGLLRGLVVAESARHRSVALLREIIHRGQTTQALASTSTPRFLAAALHLSTVSETRSHQLVAEPPAAHEETAGSDDGLPAAELARSDDLEEIVGLVRGRAAARTALTAPVADLIGDGCLHVLRGDDGDVRAAVEVRADDAQRLHVMRLVSRPLEEDGDPGAELLAAMVDRADAQGCRALLDVDAGDEAGLRAGRAAGFHDVARTVSLTLALDGDRWRADAADDTAF